MSKLPPCTEAIISIGATEARERFSDLLSRVAYRSERIVFTRNGQDVGVLVPMDDYERLLRMERTAPDGEASGDGTVEAAGHAASPEPGRDGRRHGPPGAAKQSST